MDEIHSLLPQAVAQRQRSDINKTPTPPGVIFDYRSSRSDNRLKKPAKVAHEEMPVLHLNICIN
jgi:hypothetical protein